MVTANSDDMTTTGSGDKNSVLVEINGLKMYFPVTAGVVFQ